VLGFKGLVLLFNYLAWFEVGVITAIAIIANALAMWRTNASPRLNKNLNFLCILTLFLPMLIIMKISSSRWPYNPLHLLPIFISPYPVDLVYLTMAHLIICLATNHFFSSVLFGFIAKCYICQWFSNNSSTNWLNTSLSHTFYAFLFMTFISSLAACFTFYSFIKTPIFWLS